MVTGFIDMLIRDQEDLLITDESSQHSSQRLGSISTFAEGKAIIQIRYFSAVCVKYSQRRHPPEVGCLPRRYGDRIAIEGDRLRNIFRSPGAKNLSRRNIDHLNLNRRWAKTVFGLLL